MKNDFYVDYKGTPFLETGKIKAESLPHRLNWRCEILLTRNRQAIEGKRVLDLASHDGMFSYACLKLGASRVTGVEGRENLIKSATNNLTALGYTKERFTFIQDDVFDYLAKVKAGEFDTILCFGIFYHTIRQAELLREIKRIRPSHFILDTFVQRGTFINPFLIYPSGLRRVIGRLRFRHLFHMPKTLGDAQKALSYEPVSPLTVKGGTPCLVLKPENHAQEWGTTDPVDLGAWPTQAFLELIFKNHDFSLKRLIWDKKDIRDWTSLQDYKSGYRASYLARPLD